MAVDFDIPPIYDPLLNEDSNHLSPYWVTYWASFYEILIAYLSQYGIFVPKVSNETRALIQNPEYGQFIYNTDVNALQVYVQNSPDAWRSLQTAPIAPFTWTVVTAASQNLSPNGGYIIDRPSSVMLIMPITATIGETIKIIGSNTGLFTIALNTGQTIEEGNVSTSAGPIGEVDSTQQGDAIELVCVQDDTRWIAQSVIGNLTYL